MKTLIGSFAVVMLLGLVGCGTESSTDADVYGVELDQEAAVTFQCEVNYSGFLTGNCLGLQTCGVKASTKYCPVGATPITLKTVTCVGIPHRYDQGRTCR